MSSGSNKRKLDDKSLDLQPPIKRVRKDGSKKEHQNDCMVRIRFKNEPDDIEFKKSEILIIEFCKAKLQRWSPDIDNNDEDDEDLDNMDKKDNEHNNNINQKQCFIDLSVFPCITKNIFSAIIHLQQLFNNSSNTDDPIAIKKAAKLLLSDNIKINDVAQLLEACKILLVIKMFNKQIFKYYFDQHSPIPVETFKQLLNTHKNDEFITSIMSSQVPLYNVMNDWNAQKAVYDLYNKTGIKNCPYSGDAIPNIQHAVKYAIQQIRYEEERESYRDEVVQEYAEDIAWNEWYRDEYEYYEAQNKKLKELKKDIDFGICAAFDDMVKYGADIDLFLDVFFGFIGDTYWNSNGFQQRDDAGNILDRSHFCFYALLYIAHRVWILYITGNQVIMNNHHFHPNTNGLNRMFRLYEQILTHKITKQNNFWKTDKMKMLIQQRINDGIKYKEEWNKPHTAFTMPSEKIMEFPRAISVLLGKVTSDPEWIIDNFAMKCNNCDCRKVLHHIFTIYVERKDEITVSESVNNIFRTYLGVTLLNDK